MKYPHTARTSRRLAAMAFLAATLLPLAAFAQLLTDNANEDIDSIVALVDEDVILRSELTSLWLALSIGSKPAETPCHR